MAPASEPTLSPAVRKSPGRRRRRSGATDFFDNLFNNEWELTKSPAGAKQWKAKGAAATIPDAYDKSKKHVPTMLTTDLSLRMDPAYAKISRRFYEHPEQFADAFARAWFKLTHRDMGPIARYLGPLVPKETLIWQDPIPKVNHPLIGKGDIAALKAKILASGLSVSQLVSTAWASASTFRGSDKRGGANGARIRLAPQKDWEVNRPAELAKVLAKLEVIQKAFNKGKKKVSLADLIVLGGCAAIEKAAKKAGHDVKVPFTPGRMDASQEETDVDLFKPLEPAADGFRNYYARQAAHGAGRGVDRQGAIAETDGAGDDGSARRPARARRQCRQLQARRLHQEAGGADATTSSSTCSTWARNGSPPASDGVYEGRDRKTNALKWTGTRVDLIFGSHSQLRALAEVYACADAKEKFVKDFAAAWTKVMNADRFDLA